MGYDIVAYCSSGHKDALATCLPSWALSDTDNIMIYTDFPSQLSNDTLATLQMRMTINHFWSPNDNCGVNYTRKAESMLDYARRHPDRNVILLDVDCFICKDLGGIFEDGMQLGVTVYPNIPAKRMFNNVSAGIVCFGGGVHHASLLLQQWVKAQNASWGQEPCLDQKSLSLLIKNHFREMVTTLDMDIYNCHPYSGTKADITIWKKRIQRHSPAIVHFAHGTWKDPKLVEEVMGIIDGQN